MAWQCAKSQFVSEKRKKKNLNFLTVLYAMHHTQSNLVSVNIKEFIQKIHPQLLSLTEMRPYSSCSHLVFSSFSIPPFTQLKIVLFSISSHKFFLIGHPTDFVLHFGTMTRKKKKKRLNGQLQSTPLFSQHTH